LERDAISAELIEHFAALAELAEEIDQQPEALRINAKLRQDAGYRWTSKEFLHDCSAATIREMPGFTFADPVKFRKTSSSDDCPDDALSSSGVPWAMRLPL